MGGELLLDEWDGWKRCFVILPFPSLVPLITVTEGERYFL